MTNYSGQISERGRNRRSFIKATGAGMLGATTVIAGCSGIGKNGLTGGSSGSSESKTTITYTSRAAAIRPPAKEQMGVWISEFEEQNPEISVRLNPTQGISNQQQKYR